MWDNSTLTTTRTRVDSLVLGGAIAPVPEPEGLAAIAGSAGLAGVTVMLRRRR